MVASSAFSAKPSGSKNPMGGSAPGSCSAEKELRAVEERVVEEAGANAAAEPARAEIRASFIILFVVECSKVLYKRLASVKIMRSLECFLGWWRNNAKMCSDRSELG
jgi:hypothetical protein